MVVGGNMVEVVVDCDTVEVVVDEQGTSVVELVAPVVGVGKDEEELEGKSVVVVPGVPSHRRSDAVRPPARGLEP